MDASARGDGRCRRSHAFPPRSPETAEGRVEGYLFYIWLFDDQPLDGLLLGMVVGLLRELLHPRSHARKGSRACDKQQLLSDVFNNRGEEDGRCPGDKTSLVVLVFVHAQTALLLHIALLVLVLELAQARIDHDAQTRALPYLLHVPSVHLLGMLRGHVLVVFSRQKALELLIRGLDGVAGQSRLEHVGHGGSDGSQGGRPRRREEGEEQVVEEGIEEGQCLFGKYGVLQLVRIGVLVAQLRIVVVGDGL